jgi:hypothetical protein
MKFIVGAMPWIQATKLDVGQTNLMKDRIIFFCGKR